MSMRSMRFWGYLMIALGVASIVVGVTDSGDKILGGAGSLALGTGFFYIFGGSFLFAGLVLVYLGHQLRAVDSIKRPSLRQGLAQASAALTDINTQMATSARLATDGVDGRATIESVRDTGTLVNYDPVVEMQLQVQGPGGSPYRVLHRGTVPKLAVGRLTPGSSLPIKINRNNPQEVAIAWDRQ
jgi:hypothetical protein